MAKVKISESLQAQLEAMVRATFAEYLDRLQQQEAEDEAPPRKSPRATRHSPRLQQAKLQQEEVASSPSSSEEHEEDTEPEEEEDASPDSTSVPRPVAHSRRSREERVAFIKAAAYRKCDSVGEKRKHSVAFNEFRWADISDAYKVDDRMLSFTPSVVPLPPAKLKSMVDTLSNFVGTSDKYVSEWLEETVTYVVKTIMTTAGSCFPKDVVAVKAQEPLKLQAGKMVINGNVDMMVCKGASKVVMVEVKREAGCWSQGLAQMVIAAEAALEEKLAANPKSDECVYGLLTNCICWRWLRLDKDEGRFFESYTDTDMSKTFEFHAGVAHGVLQQAPIVKSSRPIANSDKRARR